jgi:hypothetical protein
VPFSPRSSQNSVDFLRAYYRIHFLIFDPICDEIDHLTSFDMSQPVALNCMVPFLRTVLVAVFPFTADMIR